MVWDKDKQKAYDKEYYTKNRDRIIARSRKWACENSERVKNNLSKWYEKK